MTKRTQVAGPAVFTVHLFATQYFTVNVRTAGPMFACLTSQVALNELVSVAQVLQTLQVYAQNKAQLNYIVQHSLLCY